MLKKFSFLLLILGILSISATSFAETSKSNHDKKGETTASTKPVSNIKQAGRFGMGLGLGVNSMPFSFKYFLTDSLSLQFNGPFWGFWWGFGLGLSGNMLYESAPLFDSPLFQIAYQAGGGPSLRWYTYRYSANNPNAYNSYVVYGVHGNIGIQILLKNVPIDFVLEYEPGLNLSTWHTDDIAMPQNSTRISWELSADLFSTSLNARYYF